MNENPNKNPTEARPLTDEELEQASGGRYVYHSGGQSYACDACMVWLTERIPGRWVHRTCGKEMRLLKTTQERENVTENPQYQKVSSSEGIID